MSTQSRIDEESRKDSATLEREIDQQRAEIGSIVQALENKLSPGQLLDSVLHYSKGHGGEFMGNLGRTVQANPVPTLLTGIGLLWLMTSQNRTSAPAYVETEASTGPSLAEKARQQAAGIREKAGQIGESVTDTLGSARQRLSESGHQVGDSLRQGAQRARGSFERMLDEQPLVLGAIGVAAGAALAAALPPTAQEDRMLGRASDRLTDQARHKVEEGYEKASEMGRDMADQLRGESAQQPYAQQSAQPGRPH